MGKIKNMTNIDVNKMSCEPVDEEELQII